MSKHSLPKRVVVTGGRDYPDFKLVNDILEFINPSEVYVGDARGADSFARLWAQDRAELKVFAADWNKHGKAAGPIRNCEMLDAAGPNALVISFPGGFGTANCRKEAIKRDMMVLSVAVGGT